MKVRQILDEQLKQRQEAKKSELVAKQELASWVREVDKKDLELEREKKIAIKTKVVEAKQMRDKMLHEAIAKKNQEDINSRTIEHQRCQVLLQEIEEEKKV